MIDKGTEQILEKYRKKLTQEIQIDDATIDTKTDKEIPDGAIRSREYKQFKKEMLPTHHTIYEAACNFCEKILKASPDKKKLAEITEAIKTAHLNVTPAGVSSFALLGPISLMLITALLSIGLPVALGRQPSMFIGGFFIIGSLLMVFPLQNVPFFMASSWRQKASGQMVLAVFYTVTYMRHTSNLELALEFASNRLTGPLALDLKKVIWDIETEKYSNIKDSLDSYLETWRNWNIEFIEAMHLIESSLYESSDERRLALLDKSLDVMLEETYEKMLHYAHNLKGPMTTLNMLGFVLPILGLVILPLIVNFIGGVKWYYIFMIYNIAIPAGAFILGKNILSSRPTGYGDADISENRPGLKKYKNILFSFFGKEISINPMYLAVFITALLLLAGLSPLIMHAVTHKKNIPIGKTTIKDKTAPEGCEYAAYCLLEWRKDDNLGIEDGPFDMIPSALSIFIPLGIGLGLGVYRKVKTDKLIKIREESKKIEKEFSSALFQLGNRLGDGIPAEIVFGRVGEVMKNSESGKFFKDVHRNITQRGMSVKEALFNPETGVVSRFSSPIIESSMKVMVEAIQKSPKIASEAVMSISNYIKEMHRIDERLKDLLADVISSMKSQSSFLAPTISAIVIGISSMITNVLGKIGPALSKGGGDAANIGASMEGFFGIGIPTYYFQSIVGLYVVQLIFILTVLVNGVENGADKLKEDNVVGNNLIRGALIYSVLALIVMLLFNFIADQVIGSIGLQT